MKKYIKAAVTLLVLLVVYFLFQPVLVHNFGWKPFPKNLKSLENKVLKLQVDKIFSTEYLKLKTPALSISIRKNDSVLFNKTLGFADIENKIKATSQTKFRIGSVSKALTSGGLGVLLQNNKLKLNTSVNDLFSDKYQKLSNLTIQELASHTSGIRNYETCFCFPIWEYYNNNKYESVEESVTIFAEDNLLFKPSTAFSYSSYNFTLLSLLMEKSSNKNFTSFMNEEVFTPLKMTNTSNNEKDNIAVFYQLENDEFKKVFKINNSNKIAGGGFVSTPNDLTKFGSAILNNKLFNKEVQQQLFTPIKLLNGEINKQNYGLGWRIDETSKIFERNRKVQIIHHGGVAMGSTAFLLLLPEYNISAAIVMNSNTNKGAQKLSKILYKIINELTHDDKVHSLKL
ncbi:MAG: serine hydrolase domain-containing protein [Polaribacter sp.]|uniref:serine hydrolase domain-containing protein n=1 Tax=Polaribacter sp. TaxID=1920175 RepID=UPI002F35F82D